MQLDRYVAELREHLVAAAGAGDEQVRAVAERLATALDAAVRLVLLDAVSAAADEISSDLAPGTVTVRLSGRDPEFDVTAVPPDVSGQPDAEPSAAAVGEFGERALARINLRLPEQLKARVEQAAERDGLSVNAWLVRAAAAAVHRHDRGRGEVRGRSAGTTGGARYTGWAR